MDTKECFALIKDKFPHLFTIDPENNSITLKPGFGNIPSFTLVCVEGGEFTMGSEDISDREKPPHKVNVNSFFMAEFPVTQELYNGVTGQNPSHFEGVDHPVEKVSWYDATTFCNQMNHLLALPKPYSSKEDATQCNFDCAAFRLPTEAEWEFAARGGAVETHGRASLPGSSLQPEFAGSDFPDDVAWYDQNNEYETKPVGLKFPNPLGLYDMSGNVWEWCWDRFGDYGHQPQTNPIGPSEGSLRVLRGGSWRHGAGISRVACRGGDSPGIDWSSDGFRLLLAL
ncbi:MAG: SUMF1/EgtB/PvdO family nonheme iron enzyme [Mariniphaga sp.]